MERVWSWGWYTSYRNRLLDRVELVVPVSHIRLPCLGF
nr:MAG TPA: hypothetical protein [Caudoviricetes sp.]